MINFVTLLLYEQPSTKNEKKKTVCFENTVPDPDLEVRGGGGAVSEKKFFQPFRPQFGLKIRREEGPPGSLPWIRH